MHAALNARERPANAPQKTTLLEALFGERAHGAHAVQYFRVSGPESHPEGVLDLIALRLVTFREQTHDRRQRHETEHHECDACVEPRHRPRGEPDVDGRRYELERDVRERARRVW